MNKYTQIREWYNNRVLKYGEDSWSPTKSYYYYLNLLPSIENKIIVDMGCGTGKFLSICDKAKETHGIDISDKSIEIAKRVSKNSSFYEQKMSEIFFPNNFADIIVCLGALEHNPNLKEIYNSLRRMNETIKKDGTVLVVVPNKDFLIWKIKSIGTDQQEISEHLFTLEKWKEILTKSKFEIIDIKKDLRLFTKFRGLKAFLIKKLFEIIPIKYTYQFCFLLRKKDE